ncbi:MAG: hypothetical protein ACWGMZ_13225 [Thermoguttaceae bacterium]
MATLVSFSGIASLARAGGDVRLELVGDARSAAMTFQAWGAALNRAGIANVRLRTATDTDKIGIEVQGTSDRPLYIVTGKVVSRNELQLPGVRFRRSQLHQLSDWLDDLAKNGPPEKRPKLGAFGLRAEQNEQVRKDLAQRVGFSTEGLALNEAVDKIARKLSIPLRFERQKHIGAALDSELMRFLPEDKVEDKLRGLSCGTALAYLLRQADACFAPRSDGNKLIYLIMKNSSARKETWTVGKSPEGPPMKILPGLYESHNVNVQNVPAAAVLETIGKRLKTPVVYDRIALSKHQIDPAKVLVNHPYKRTNYSLALRRMLFPVGLKFELRVDDAGAPFLWIHSLKPM